MAAILIAVGWLLSAAALVMGLDRKPRLSRLCSYSGCLFFLVGIVILLVQLNSFGPEN